MTMTNDHLFVESDSAPTTPSSGPEGMTVSWRDFAVCKGVSLDMFFEEENYPEARRMYCDKCPVQGPCLDESILVRERYGIWGGFAPKKRATIARRQRRTKAQMHLELEAVVEEMVLGVEDEAEMYFLS